MTYTATFSPDSYTVSLHSADSSQGSVTGGGTTTYLGTRTIHAYPLEGYHFSHWSDGTLLSSYSFPLVANKQLIAPFIPASDTVYGYIHDTTYLTQTDTITQTLFDTIVNTVHDTIFIAEFDTVYILDTIYIHDTIFVSIDEVDNLNAKIYTDGGQVVVDGASDNTVRLYDINGRLLATKQDYCQTLRFDIPTSGSYIIKIGNHPARKMEVVR